MNEILVQENQALKGLLPSKAKEIKDTFEPMVEMLESFEKAFDEVTAKEISPEVCIEARELRLKIRTVRTSADKERKKLKEEHLRAGNAVQGVYNILKFAVAEREERLLEIEEHFQRIEEEKKKARQAVREAELLRYESDGSQLDLGGMDDAVWSNYLTGVKSNYKAIKDAEAKAEEDRREQERKESLLQHRKSVVFHLGEFFPISELNLDTPEEVFVEMTQEAEKNKASYEAEQEKIQKENEKLRKQKEAADRKARKEREAREAEERERREAEKARERAKREEEEKRVNEARKAASAPDREKLEAILEYLNGLNWDFSTDTGKVTISGIKVILAKGITKLS